MIQHGRCRRCIVPGKIVLNKGPVPITERHHHDHRLDLACGEQVVENEVCPLIVGPALSYPAEAVHEVENRIGLGCVRVVTRRRIDHDLFLVCRQPKRNLRGESMRVQRPVRNVGLLPRLRGLALDNQNAAGWEDEILSNPVVLAIDSWDSVNQEIVVVDLRG